MTNRLLAAAPLALVPLLFAAFPVGEGEALERALDAVRAEDIKADIHFIASDELAGRDTPSEGLRVAARFIRARLQRLGFEPGAEDGYFHEYPLVMKQLDPERSDVRLEPSSVVGGEVRSLAFGSDYIFSPTEIANTEYSAPIVFVGSENDLGGVDLAGRVGLTWDEGGSTRKRRRAARAAGALALIVTPGPEYDGKPYAERYERYVGSALRGRPSYPRGNERSSGAEGKLETTTVYLSRSGARGLVPEGAKPGTELGYTWSETRKGAGNEDGLVMMENVAGFWRGSDPELSKEVIILSAHYDHVGKRGEVVYNGADDNGSGTCGLMAVAEALKAYGPMRRSILILWVSGEEKGLWGSQAWTEKPWLPEGCRAVCNVNIDMIGRNAPDKLLITPTPDHKAYNALSRLAGKLGPLEGFPSLGSADAYWDRSDHRNFYVNLDIPVAFLFSDVHEDYHQPGDTADKIDNDKVRRVVRLVVRMLDALQADELPQ